MAGGGTGDSPPKILAVRKMFKNAKFGTKTPFWGNFEHFSVGNLQVPFGILSEIHGGGGLSENCLTLLPTMTLLLQ